MSEVVLDSSALLAWLAGEDGGEKVQQALGAAAVSCVNLAEVLTKLADRGVPEPEQRRIVANLGLVVTDFDESAAWTSAALRSTTRAQGLSFGDRACLALALRRGVPALTADRRWSNLDLGIEIRLIR
jgi:PIN domain nuclease of toxin-antitoxin system